MMSLRIGRVVLPALVLLLVVIGCKKENPNAPASVSGKVTYNGAPVSAGMIVFHLEQGSYSAPLSPDGSYSTADIPTGAATITVDTEMANPDRKVDAYKGGEDSVKAKYAKGSGGGFTAPSQDKNEGRVAEASPMPNSAKNMPKGAYVKIPSKYNDREQSKLSVTLKRGDNKNDFNLTD